MDESKPIGALNFELLSKLLPVVLACVYLTGFIVVMGNLSQYGVASLEAFKLQYFVAGVWCLFPASLFYFGQKSSMLPAILLHDTRLAPTPRKRAALTIGVLFLVLVLPSLLVVMFYLVLGYPTTGPATDWKLIGGLASIYLIAMILELLEREWVTVLPDTPTLVHWPTKRRLLFLTLVQVKVLLLLVYVAFFSVKIYPYIPHRFGGGEPLEVTFVLPEGGSSASSFLIRDGNSLRTITYKLLLEKENSLVVVSASPKERAIEFDRKTISAMIVLKGRVEHP